ncbi:MAG: hypothetical protein JST00_27520 [Deltaproteobacteria bacterium]|nr:hypothetical protein [Deltaproteobacteria bacterium]
MRFLRLASFALPVALLLLFSPFARADGAEAPEAMRRPVAHDDLLVVATAGGMGDGGDVGGSLGVVALRQSGWLGYGATFDYGGKLFDYEVVGVAPMIGLFLDTPRWARVGLAATAGVHAYSGVGKGLFTRDPGASGTTGFVGARLFLGGEVGGAARLHVGMQLSAEEDLARLQRSYTFEGGGFGAPRLESTTHTIGAFRYGALLALGGAFDL